MKLQREKFAVWCDRFILPRRWISRNETLNLEINLQPFKFSTTYKINGGLP